VLMTLDLPLTRPRAAMLIVFSVAVALLVPLELYLAGGFCAALAALLIARDDCRPLRRRMGVLLGCVLLLSAAPIDTSTAPRHFLTLGLPMLGCVLLPALILRRTDPGVIRYRWFPRRFRLLDMFYLAISAPLAWVILRWYFGFNDFMPFQWPLPEQSDPDAMTRLFWGINGVGVWDELFFVNTGFAILRSLFSLRIANLTQAVLYTAVLYDMAFAGIGPVVVYLFALTQGAMFEESENLLYVLVVHLVVDYFLYWQIVMGHYPAYIKTGFLH
jgi:hypothetical protein